MKIKKFLKKKAVIKKPICPQCGNRKDLNYRIHWRSPHHAHLQYARDVCKACYMKAPIGYRIKK